MPTSLWPDFPTDEKQRGMRQMLEDAGGDIAEKTRRIVQFRVKTSGQGDKFEHDCYLAVPKAGYEYLLLRVSTGTKPFPATISTTRGSVENIVDENGLRGALQQIFQQQETREVVESLIVNFKDYGPREARVY